MTPFKRPIVASLALLLAATAPISAGPRKVPVGEAEIQKLTAASPEAAPAKPKKPRKVLIYTRATGYYHASIPLGAKAFEVMGTKTGAYSTVTSDDPESFDPAKLKDIDAIVMMSSTGDLFVDKGEKAELLRDTSAPLSPGLKRSKALRDSLLAFVKSGKGIIGLHAATDSSYDWPEYGEMMGGYFNGHPWGPVVLRLDDPTNPVNAAFEGKPFAIRDEMYTFKPPYSRTRLHILTSIDLEASKSTKGFNRPQDHDYAVSWLNRYGDGRVFYSSLGHGDGTFYNPTVLKHFLAGLQFAIGDLEADASPSGPLSPERLAANMRIGNAGFNRVGSHDAWYRSQKRVDEKVFAGTLSRVTTPPGKDEKSPAYRLDDVPVVVGAATHPLLEPWIGKRVEIFGRQVDGNIWASEARPAPASDKAASSSDAVELYNGKDLSGWCYKSGDKVTNFDALKETPDKQFSAKDGVIVVNDAEGKAALWTTREFTGDFELRFEFRAAVKADSGVFLKKPQLQVRDYPTAGPYTDLKKYKPQDWNEMLVVVKGETVVATCNGEELKSERVKLKVPPTGGIGLEADRGVMEYRNLRLTETK